MKQKGLSSVFALWMPVIWLLVSVCWCLARPSRSTSIQNQETSHSTPQAAEASSAGQGEECRLQPYKGTTPLDQVQYYSPGEEDLRGGMICTFRINSNLPLFAFHFAGNEDNTFGNIQITEGTGGKVIQTIENTTDPGLIMPAKAKDVLTAVDANFDGYKDLQLLSGCGATGNCSYDFYLYDPKANRFVHNDFLTSLTTPSFDQGKKQVTTHSNSSASDWSTETYQYHDGQYTLIYRQESSWDRDRQVVTVNTYELRNGKMVLTDSTTGPE